MLASRRARLNSQRHVIVAITINKEFSNTADSVMVHLPFGCISKCDTNHSVPFAYPNNSDTARKNIRHR